MIIPSLRLGAVGIAAACTAGCVTLPELDVAPRSALGVAAPTEITWESALDQLAEQGLAVRTVEKGAGFIATETVALPMFTTDARRWADCGTFAGFRYAPTAVDYTIFVREDSAGSAVKASARYRVIKTAPAEAPTECVSTGAFEASFAAAVKQRAEAER